MKSKRGFSVHRQGGTRVAVEVRREGRGRWTVAQLERVPEGKSPTGSLGRTMGHEAGSVAWLLDDTEARTSVVSLPSLKGRALQRAAQGIVARAEGGVPETWAVSCQVLGPTRRAGTAAEGPKLHDVFILQAARSVVDAKLAEATSWGVQPGLMLPAHLAMDELYRRHGPERDEHESWNLVFIGREVSFLCISTRDHLLMTRRLPQDLSGGADPEEYLGRIATEIERSIYFAKQTENSPHVERIIVCGDHEVAPRVVARLGQQDLAPAIFWEIESLFVWGETTPQVDDLLAVAGAVLACEGSPHSLCTQHRHRAFSTAARRRLVIGAGAFGVTAVPLLLIGGLMASRIQTEYLEKTRGRLLETQARAEQAEEIYRAQRILLARENRIATFTAARPDLESVLHQLAALTPPTVVFKSMHVQEADSGVFVLQLEGESPADRGADAQSAFVDFLAALRGCDFATMEGEPRRMHIRPDDVNVTGERTLFSLDLRLTPVSAPEGI